MAVCCDAIREGERTLKHGILVAGVPSIVVALANVFAASVFAALACFDTCSPVRSSAHGAPLAILTSVTWLAPALALTGASGLETHLDAQLWRDREKLCAQMRTATALIVRNQTQVDAELLACAPHVRVVGRLGAEYVIAALLHVYREIGAAEASTHAGGWDRTRFGGMELSGKTLGLIGAGEIGRRVATRAFGMHIVAYDPLVGPYDCAPAEQQVALLPFDEVLRVSDCLSLHVPLLPTTHHLINRAALARMRPGAVLINTSRGGIVDEQALLAALAAGTIRHAILDVCETEPPAVNDSLLRMPHLTLTPHVAGVTSEAQERTSRLVVSDVLRVLAGERAIGTV